MGLCVKCRVTEAVNKDDRCVECSREYYRNFYKKRKELGICIKCNRSNDNKNNLLCYICSQKAATRQNDRRMSNKKRLLCVVCCRKTDGQHSECEKCRTNRNNTYIGLSDKASSEGKCGQCRKNIPKEGLKTCDECSEQSRKYYLKTKSQRQRKNKDIKLSVFDHYGHKCVCCEESHELLLTVDHINNDGKNHREKIGSGVPIYKEIISMGFPSFYQLLCFNCNMGKYLNNGVCPHQEQLSGV